MSKDIAVLLGNINFENQKRILDGMIDAAKETDNSIYVFSNYISASENKETIQGAYQIMELPDFEYFDAVIVALNTIAYPPVASYVMDKIRTSKIPALTLERPMEGYGCLSVSSYDAQYQIVEHMIVKHDCRKIVYIRGPHGNKEADIRFRAYCDALHKHDIAYREELVFDGTFGLESGVRAVKKMIEQEIHPDAIVCGNDNMAVGVLEFLKEIGWNIPEDVKISGFDNEAIAKYSSPSITSVDKNPYELGYRSIFEMLEIINGKRPEIYQIVARPDFRTSCGCTQVDEVDVDELKHKYIQQDVYMIHMSEVMRGTLAELLGLQRPEDALEILKKYVKKTNIRSFYLCLCEKDKVFMLPETNMGNNFDLMQVNTDYTKKIELPLAYEDGEFHSYKSFKKGMVLPRECRQRGGGNYYVITPVYFQSCCYGYCVSGNNKLPLCSSIYYSWLMNIGVAYENIRKYMMLQDAVVRLNNAWSYDMLTQLYNRAGFFYEAKTILEILKFENSKIFLLFSDVDGLKQINDTLGHEMGDQLIKEYAACIRENITADMLAMRYGGDEFVIFGAYEDEKEVECLINALRAAMTLRNQSGLNAFTLSASIGVSTYMAREIGELNDLIEEADKNMYEEKRRKREMLL